LRDAGVRGALLVGGGRGRFVPLSVGMLQRARNPGRQPRSSGSVLCAAWHDNRRGARCPCGCVISDIRTFLLLPELRGRVELRAKAMHKFRSLPTIAAPSSVCSPYEGLAF
jgi:hypothetical protein